MRCLSVPDPLSQHPQIERGSTCAASDRWISLGMGRQWVGVVDRGTRAPVLRQPDGSREDLDGSSGLVVVQQAPDSRVTLFDARGKGRGDSGRGETIPWSCGDGRRFDFDARRMPKTDPCLEPAADAARARTAPAAELTYASPGMDAFVLGGGGQLGASEVGMLRALLEHDIVPDLVVGT